MSGTTLNITHFLQNEGLPCLCMFDGCLNSGSSSFLLGGTQLPCQTHELFACLASQVLLECLLDVTINYSYLIFLHAELVYH